MLFKGNNFRVNICNLIRFKESSCYLVLFLIKEDDILISSIRVYKAGLMFMRKEYFILNFKNSENTYTKIFYINNTVVLTEFIYKGIVRKYRCVDIYIYVLFNTCVFDLTYFF